MGGLLRGKVEARMPEQQRRPRPVRQPVESDPEALAAQQRALQAARLRRGRLATVLSGGANPEKAMTGSSGVKLGA